jgi:maltose-binding protein MalE
MAVNCNYACMTSSFESETSVMAINGTWIFDKWLALLGEDLGVVALPSLEGRPMRPYYSSHVLAFPNNSLDGAKRSDIKKLSQFIQSEAVQKQVWSQLKALPVRDDVLDTLAHAQPDVVTLMAGLKYALPMPNDIEMAYVWEAMLKGITRYEAGIMSSIQAADYMQYIANKSITHAQQKYSH